MPDRDVEQVYLLVAVTPDLCFEWIGAYSTSILTPTVLWPQLWLT